MISQPGLSIATMGKDRISEVMARPGSRGMKHLADDGKIFGGSHRPRKRFPSDESGERGAKRVVPPRLPAKGQVAGEVSCELIGKKGNM
jgi:hypothetical protein